MCVVNKIYLFFILFIFTYFQTSPLNDVTYYILTKIHKPQGYVIIFIFSFSNLMSITKKFIFL